LVNGRAEPVAQFDLLHEDGSAIEVERIVARFDELHILSGGGLYRVNVHEAISRSMR
jgi:hypothetical protein